MAGYLGLNVSLASMSTGLMSHRLNVGTGLNVGPGLNVALA